MAERNTSAENRCRVLVADDDATSRRLWRMYLERAGHDIIEAGDGAQAKELMDDSIEVAILDIEMPHATGLECLQYIKEKYPHTEAIILSAHGDISTVVEAMKLGAFWYLSKNCHRDELLSLVAQAAEHARLSRTNSGLIDALGEVRLPLNYIAGSTASKEVLDKIQRIAQLDSTALLTGESGTGKSVVAKLIHELGPRKNKPFVTVSCAAIPRDLLEAELFGHEKGAFTGAVNSRPGRIEIADGGTLFLDEIGDMPLELQPKLLVFLQERAFRRVGSNKMREVDVRVITATHRTLEQMCSEGSFREDLFYRVNVLPLSIPALRERPEDVVPIAEHFLAQVAARRGASPLKLSDEAAKALMSCSWPGNVRELENILERATAFSAGKVIEEKDLALAPARETSGKSVGGALAGMTLEDIERRAIEQTLASCGGNKAAAARTLGISEKSIYNKMRRLGVSSD